MKRVFLEGPIAVGKSAAMEQIALDEELWSVSQEPLQKLEGRRLMDGTFREFLKPYYWQRSPENSRLMQTSALLAFLERFEEEGDVRPGCPVRIYERSLASSRDVFLQALELPSVDRTLLYELTSWGIRTFEAGALRVYLDAVPDVLAERFYRRNRPSESGMSRAVFEDLHRRMDAWGQEECDVVICVEGKTPREVAWEVSDAVREFLERGDRGPAELPLRGGSIV